MLKIYIKNANVCQLDGDFEVMQQLYKDFQMKHPNAWHIRMYSKTKWDGVIKFISARGVFKTGLLKSVYEKALTYTDKVTIVDQRFNKATIKPTIPEKMGNLTLYPDQKKALRNILKNKVGGVPFLICSTSLAVGFGKTLIMAGLYKAFRGELKTLILLNDSDLFNQFKKEIPELVPDEHVTFVQGAKVDNWSNFSVAMVPSLSRNLKKYQYELSQIDMVLIDECDTIDNKTYKNVIEQLYNTVARIGLSGTLYKGKLKKYELSNMNIRSFIGDPVEHVSLAKQMKKGRATPVIVKMIELDYPVEKYDSYQEEYNGNIVNNKNATRAIINRLQYNIRYGRIPALVVVKFIPHCENLAASLQKAFPDLKVKYIHHNVKKRNEILQEFREGKFDILVSTIIISRGKNAPLIKYILNASSMDAEERTIQILGRAVRKHETKKKAYLDDLMFPGRYLQRHGKHRKNYYLIEGLKVIMLPRNVKQRKRAKAKSLKKGNL